MPIYDLLAAVSAAGIGMAVLWFLRRQGGVDRGGPRGDLITYVGVAGIASLVCAVMNIVEVVGGGVTAAAVGNATNVFAAAMMWACGRRLNARSAIGVATAGASALLLFAATFVVPLDDATLIKTAGIAVFSFLTLVEFRHEPLRHSAGAAIIAIAMGLFGVFNVGRLVIAFGVGIDSWTWKSFASAEVTSIVSAALILSVSLAAVRLGRHLADDPAPGTRAHGRTFLRRRGLNLLAEHATVIGLALRIPDLELIRAAHGPERAADVIASLVAATGDALPDAEAETVSRDTVVALLPGDTERAGIDRAIAERFSARKPMTVRAGTPDIVLSYRDVSDRDELDAFLSAAARRRHRRRQPALDG